MSGSLLSPHMVPFQPQPSLSKPVLVTYLWRSLEASLEEEAPLGLLSDQPVFGKALPAFIAVQHWCCLVSISVSLCLPSDPVSGQALFQAVGL